MDGKNNCLNINIIDDWNEINGNGSCISNTEDPQIYKDSLENSVSQMMNNLNITDSLNNTILKTSFKEGKTDELSTDEKTQYSTNMQNVKKSIIKTKISTLDQISKEMKEETKKITYKYVSKAKLMEEEKKLKEATATIYHLENVPIQSEGENYYWYAAYDKLLKTKNMEKILKYYGNENNSEPVRNFQEKGIIVKNFDIFCRGKPFIKPLIGGFAFVKLYYLKFKDINKIYNYINKTEAIISEDDLRFNNNIADYHLVHQKNVAFPYSHLLCLGSFLNTNIYTFTNSQDSFSTIDSNGKDSEKPKMKILSRMVKYLSIIFPYYSSEFFIYHLFSKSGINNSNYFISHLNDIKNYLSKNPKSNGKKLNFISETNVNNNFQIGNIKYHINSNEFPSRLALNNGNSPDSQLKLMNNTTCSSCQNAKNGGITNISIANKGKKSVICGKKQPFRNAASQLTDGREVFNTVKLNASSQLANRSSINKTPKKSQCKNVYVVKRRMKTDIENDTEEEDSLSSNQVNGRKEETNIKEQVFYETPKKKKVLKYYT